MKIREIPLGTKVKSVAIGTCAEFVGVVDEVCYTHRGRHYHVKDDAGERWHRTDQELSKP